MAEIRKYDLNCSKKRSSHEATLASTPSHQLAPPGIPLPYRPTLPTPQVLGGPWAEGLVKACPLLIYQELTQQPPKSEHRMADVVLTLNGGHREELGQDKNGQQRRATVNMPSSSFLS